MPPAPTSPPTSSATSPLTIRRAAPGDWPALWSLFAATVAGGDTYAFAPDTPEADARRFLLGPGADCFVAERRGEVVGAYVIRPNLPGLGAHVANAGYMVRPGEFGGGIGTAMGEHSLAEARAAGYRAMQFNAVVSTNTRAVALWERLGFRIIGTVPEAFRHAREGYVALHIMYRAL